MKKLLGTLIALGAMALMAVGVQAATYSAGVVNAENGVATVPVVVTPDEGETELVNGYVMTFTYDSTMVTPMLAADDVTGADCYATAGADFADGVLVSDIVKTEGNMTTLAVAWAGADPVSVSETKSMATVNFSVDEEATGDVPVAVAVASLTNDGKAVAGDDSYVVNSGDIVIDTDYILGDVDGNGRITATDASLVAQHAVGFITLDEKQIIRADVDGNERITATDASLIAQYAVGFINKFPAEQ